ncbi:homeodomain-only protein [Pseudoliparis swirei]|uniref:homeodomain-only protein n=1 Tax=Pseudoliparis swirei TaxID=2059687 RepID=UPI0024BE0802|nr:homeodomain-only protein [Pseudoliparis swirei]
MSSQSAEGLDLSEEQVKVLEDSFKKTTRHPEGMTLMLIAAESGLSEEDTQKWFNLRNQQWRREEGLPAELGSVLD